MLFLEFFFSLFLTPVSVLFIASFFNFRGMDRNAECLFNLIVKENLGLGLATLENVYV